MDVAQALALPKVFKRCKIMLKLWDKGNYNHNMEVKTSRTGLLKLKRKSKKEYESKDYVHCMCCQTLYLRKNLWRHVRKCSLKPREDMGIVRPAGQIRPRADSDRPAKDYMIIRK